MLTPPHIVAQALGVNASDVPPSLAARNSNAGFLTRMAAPPNNTLDVFRTTSLLQPPQSAAQVHRFSFAHGNTPTARTPKRRWAPCSHGVPDAGCAQRKTAWRLARVHACIYFSALSQCACHQCHGMVVDGQPSFL